MSWVVERRRAAARGSLELGTQPTHRWEREGPEYPTRIAAKAACARAMIPDLRHGQSDAFAARHFDQMARNFRTHRVVRLRA